MKKLMTTLIASSLLTGVLFASEGHTSKYKSNSPLKPYHVSIDENGYNVMVSTKKPLTSGKNVLTVIILKDRKVVKGINNIEIIFEKEGSAEQRFQEKAEINRNKYTVFTNFSTNGKWSYELIFKTSDGSINKVHSTLNIGTK